jgi:small subunit ribosomal protein S20
MAHSRTAKKRVRQNASSRALNKWRLTTMREAIRDFNNSILHGDLPKAAEQLKSAMRVIDRSAAKGVIHKNQAARRKSTMTKRLLTKRAETAKAPAAKKA